jgi:hypothetical protein
VKLTVTRFILIYRILFALLVTIAIIVQMGHSMTVVPDFSIINFFSFFTVESNLFGVVIFAMAAFSMRQKKRDPELDSLRGAATFYLFITGLIYCLLLTGVDVQASLPWANAVLHYIFPVVSLVDWLLDPPKHKVSTKTSMLWLSFPLLYAIYSLIRGPLAANNWYPYPFINAHKYGYAKVLLNCLVLALAMLVLARLVARAPQVEPAKKQKTT